MSDDNLLHQLTIVSSPKSPLHPLVQAAQASFNESGCRYDRRSCEPQQPPQQASPSQPWAVANLIHSWARGRRESTDAKLAEIPGEVPRRSRRPSSAAYVLTAQQERQILSSSTGSRVATFRVKFNEDLLQGELDWTEDNPEAVLARFQLEIAGQIERSFASAGGRSIVVTDATYDAAGYTLYFTLDPVNQSKTQQSDELAKCVNYLTKLVECGLFWVEYPQSELTFCPPQEAKVKIAARH